MSVFLNYFLPFAALVLLGLVTPVMREFRPRPGANGLVRKRRLIITAVLRLIQNAILLIIFEFRSGNRVGPTLGSAASIPIVARARQWLSGEVWQTIVVVAALVALALLAASVQYVLRPAFRDRWSFRTLDEITIYTGRIERGIRAFDAVADAAVAEEFLYRALLPAFLLSLTGNVVAAFVIALIMFTLGHTYQGWWGVLSSFLGGIALTAIYLVTQQIGWAIAFHAAVNAMATVGSQELVFARRRRAARRAITRHRAALAP